jgi:hypothetical protein
MRNFSVSVISRRNAANLTRNKRDARPTPASAAPLMNAVKSSTAVVHMLRQRRGDFPQCLQLLCVKVTPNTDQLVKPIFNPGRDAQFCLD